MSSKSFYMALEQRILLDAAGFSTAVDVAVDGQNAFSVPSADQRKQVDNLLSAFTSQESEDVKASQIVTLVIADHTVLDVEAVVGEEYSDSEVRYFDCQREGFERLTEIIESIAGSIRSVHILFPSIAARKLRLPQGQLPSNTAISREEEEIDGVTHWRIGPNYDATPSLDVGVDVLQVAGNLVTELTPGDSEAGASELSIGNFKTTETTQTAVVTGLFGDLNIDLISGEYRYRLNTVSPLVQVLEGDEAPVENFSYSITGPRGDSITALLVLTVNNQFPSASASDSVPIETISRRLNGAVVELSRHARTDLKKARRPSISASVLPSSESFGGLSIQNSLQGLAAENQFLPFVYTLLHEVKQGAASTFLVSLSISDPVNSRKLISLSRGKKFELSRGVESGELVFEADGSFSYSPPHSEKLTANPGICQESFSCRICDEEASGEVSVTISLVENRVATRTLNSPTPLKKPLKAGKASKTGANVAGTLKPVDSVVHIVAGRSATTPAVERKSPRSKLADARPPSQKTPTKTPRMTITLVDQVIESQEDSVFCLKEEAFGFKSGTLANCEARGGHSARLPDFIRFDSQSLQFEVDVKSALQRAWNCIPLTIRAISTSGEEVSSDFTIIISDAAQKSALRGMKLNYKAGTLTSGGIRSFSSVKPLNSAMSELEAYRLSMKQADAQHGISKSATENGKTRTAEERVEEKETRKGIVKLLKDLVGVR